MLIPFLLREYGAMCHHYVGMKKSPSLYVDAFSIRTNLYQLPLPDKGFWPLSKVPIIRAGDEGEREMVPAEWGLLPSWWKPSDKIPQRASFQRKCVNARSEEVETKPSYRQAFKYRRCLLPADEFFECDFYFHLPDHKPFALAGLWEQWQGAEGEIVESCTMLTTAANSAVLGVGNDRMAVVLTSEEQYALWLNPDLTERQRLEPLFLPIDPAAMQSYPASRP